MLYKRYFLFRITIAILIVIAVNSIATVFYKRF